VAGRKTYGRAFPIREADIGAYRMARKPRGYRANPMGVTTLASVNGRGAYSARAATQGLSKAERVARARRLVSNRSGSMAMTSNKVHRAAFVRRMNENSGSRRKRTTSGGRRRARRAGRKLHANRRTPTGAESRAYASGYARIYGKKRKKAKRSAPKRAAAPKRRRHRRSPEQVAARKAKKAAASAKRKARTAARVARRKASTAKKRERAAARRAKSRTPEARSRKARKRAKSRWPKQTRKVRARGGRKTRRVRVAYGPYKRASLYDARRGRKRASYMTRGRKRRLRKIPAWAIAGAISAKEYKTSASYAKAKERIAKRRAAAARRAERGQDPFTPNPGARKMARAKKRKKKAGSRKGRRHAKKGHRKSAKRVRAGKKAAATRRRKKAARTAAAKKSRRHGRRKSAHRRKKSHRRKSARRARKAGRRSARRGSKRRGLRIGRRKVRRLKRGIYLVKNRRTRRRYAENRGVRRRSHKRRSRRLSANIRRRKHSKRRRSGRGRKFLMNGRYMRNGFGGDLKSLLKTGSLIVVGFFAHKALTKVTVDLLTDTTKGTFVMMPLVGADGAPTFLATWQKPITGFVLGGAVIYGVSKTPFKAESRMAVSAGVMVSFLESLVKTALTVMNQPKALSYLEGYSNSTAYALRGARGRRRRPMHGLGVARNATSIMPQYAPIGQFRQAAAGMGEYFASSGMGEYFAGPGVQGVGHYEKAGPLALQPHRANIGAIDDGIRPDSDLDHVLDLAESAAGLGQGFRQAAAGMGQFRQAAAGMGEFFTAAPQNGGFSEQTVPTQSQWIPNGPLWAGTMTADSSKEESQIPAGILQGAGGNGVLSG